MFKNLFIILLIGCVIFLGYNLFLSKKQISNFMGYNVFVPEVNSTETRKENNEMQTLVFFGWDENASCSGAITINNLALKVKRITIIVE